MKSAVVFSILLCVVLTSQATKLPERLTGYSGLLRNTIKMQPKELVDECLDCQPWPTSQDLDVRKLTILLGSLSNGVVSITKPIDFSTSKILNSFSNSRKRMVQEYVRETSKAYRKHVTPKERLFLVDWLLQQSGCPMKAEWSDMGPFSWPRYVKRVFCVGKACSLESGMNCTATGRQTFPLLRWHCVESSHKDVFPSWPRKKFVERNGYFCRWIKYYYPITTSCSCKCGTH